MRSVIVAGALVAIANAAPAYTVTEVTDVYTTVYEDAAAAPAPTPKAHGQKWWWKNGNNNRAKPTTAAAVVTVTPTPEAAPAPAADYSYSAPAPAAPEPAPAAPATPAAPAPASNAPNDYAKEIVDHHNLHRANHSAPALSWDAGLAATALKIANSCNYAHDTATDGGGYGQNIAAGCPADNITSVITELFYNNEVGYFDGLYGQATPSNLQNEASFDKYGHFTQIIWKGTTAVGCATVDCSGQGKGPKGLGGVDGSVPPIFTVCNYKSPGNFLGEFNTNVLPSIGNPTIHWNS